MRYVKADKPLTSNHPTLGLLSVEVETPQLESNEEATQFANGDQNLLSFINTCIDTYAKNAGRAVLRTAPDDANVEEVKAKAIRITRDWQMQGEKSVSVRAKAEKYDDLASRLAAGEEVTKEELLAMFAASK